jgi:hypothetical protein
MFHQKKERQDEHTMNEYGKQLPFELSPEYRVREKRFEEAVRSGSACDLYKITKEGKQCT